MELTLDEISRTANGLHLAVSIDSPSSGPDDEVVHSLLVRITDEQAGVPAEVTADVEGTFELLRRTTGEQLLSP